MIIFIFWLVVYKEILIHVKDLSKFDSSNNDNKMRISNGHVVGYLFLYGVI